MSRPSTPPNSALTLAIRSERRPLLGLLAVVTAAILLGTGALLSPLAHHGHLAPVDALLLATSAVCTTGLSSVDISQVLTPTGQLLLAALIEIGALGLLLIAFGAMQLGPRSASRRLEASQQLGLNLSQGNTGQVRGMLRRLLGLTLGLQALGALIMLPAFIAVAGPVQGLRFAFMHAVMAFGNAGFGVWPDGVARLPAYALITLMLLVIAGSSGFMTLHELEQLGRYRLLRWLKRPTLPRPARLSTQTRVGLLVTAGLLLLGALSFALIEWSNPATLGPMAWPDKLLHATFQTAVTRSAGFSTLDYSQFSPLSLVLIILLMFVGGNSGSTAGGIKTSTLAVLLAATFAVLRGQQDTVLAGRRVTALNLMRALTIVTLAGLAVSLGSLLLMVTDGQHRPIVLVFEAVSAFTTSGLSVNLTPTLSAGGKLVLVALMFLGRIGFLSLLLAFTRAQSAALRHPEEHNFTVG